MKKLPYIYFIIVVLLASACSKNSQDSTPIVNTSNSSNIQFFLATVGASRNLITVDGNRINRPTLAAGTCFPTAVYPSTNTSLAFAIGGGLHSFTVVDTLVTTMQKPLTFAGTFEAGKYYSIFMYDTITNPKQVTVESKIEIPADNTARLRFANFIHDVNAVPAVEVFSTRRNEVVFPNVNKTDVTSFIPYSSTVNDTLIVRQVGTTTALATFNGFFPTQKRSYTLVYRGSNRTPTTTPKAVTVFANY